MEYKSFKIDFSSLALLVTAISSAWFTYKGLKNSKKDKENKK